MIRSFIRCTNMYKNLLAYRSNYILPAHHHFSSSVGPTKHRKKLSSHLDQDPTVEESTSIPLNKNRQSMTSFIQFLSNKLNCPDEEAMKLCIDHPDLMDKNLSDSTKNIDLLLEEGVTPTVILNNPRMLTQNHKQLCCNLNIVKEMKPKDINDFVPLVQVSTTKLVKLKRSAKSEEDVVPKKHRIYYMSDAMNIEPCIITQFISRRLFLLDVPFEMIQTNLQIMLKYIAPMDILHDLWSFRYPPDVIELRLTQAKLGDKKKLMPWMIRCPEEKLLKSIQITADEKTIVGNKTIVKYLSDRLRYDVKTTEAIMQRHPQVYNVRVTRMKEILDYLFAAGFSPVDIAQTPRIFCHSLQTTRKRLDELKSLGCRPQSLTTVCKSANEYDKFVKNWIQVREVLKEKNIVKE